MKFERKLLIIVIIFSVLATSSFAIKLYLTPDEYVEVDVIKIIENNIVFGNNCTVITATTSPDRARSIQLGLEGTIDNRPTSHDVFSNILKNFNITLDNITIHSRDDDFYYSDMYLRTENKVLKLDSMPSDAMALALRTGSTIYLNKTLLEQDGTNICE